MKNHLIARREQLNLTQKDVANSIDQMMQAYQRYEYGVSMPSVKAALKIARALDTTVEELFELEEGD